MSSIQEANIIAKALDGLGRATREAVNEQTAYMRQRDELARADYQRAREEARRDREEDIARAEQQREQDWMRNVQLRRDEQQRGIAEALRQVTADQQARRDVRSY